MTQDTLHRRGGDLFHGACLTDALKENALIVEAANVEADEVCTACSEPLVVPEGAPDADDAEKVHEGEKGEEAP